MKIYSVRNLSFLLLLFLTASITSCEWLRPAREKDKEKVYKEEDLGEIQGTKVFDPETGEWRTVREVSDKLDTVQWRTLPEKDYPPIMTDGKWSDAGNNNNPDGGNNGTPTVPGGGYDVSLVLPFLANQSFENIDKNAYWAIHFYGGAKLAYDNIASEGSSFNIQVSDTEGSRAKVNRIINDAKTKNAELIIGPYKRDNVRVVEPFSKRNEIPFVVPYTAQLGLAKGNPNYIQMNPSLKSHCATITKHARAVYDTEDITLIAQEKGNERSRFGYFQEANSEIAGDGNSARFREYLVTLDENNVYELDMTPYISQGRTSVFIVPSWSNESFVYAVLRALMVEQAKGENIIVYGMPMWMDFTQIDYEFYQKLNVHVSSAIYINEGDEKIRQFKRKFFDTYGAMPKEEAYLGYDAMNYFGKMLAQHGKGFPKVIDQYPYDVMHGRFEFERVVLNPEEHKEDLDFYDQLENKHVHILQFRNFQFQPSIQ